MKVLSPLLLALLLPASQATNLREGGHHRRLNTATINAAIAAILPSMNALIQAQITDPITIDKTFSKDSTDSTTCGGKSITFSTTINKISGTSSTEITSLTVVEGTDKFNVACDGTTTFQGDFNYVAGATAYATTGSGSITPLDTTTCSSVTFTSVAGTVTKPKFTGVIYIEGKITANKADVTKAELKSIAASCESTSITYTPSLTSTTYESLLNSYSGSLGTELKNYVSTTVADVIKAAINTGVSNSVAPLGLGGGIPYQIMFAREAAETQYHELRATAEAGIANAEARVAAAFTIVQGRVSAWQQAGSNLAARLGFQIGPPPVI